MTRFGYTLMTEQSGPRELVGYAVAAEQAGFDFEVCSDHYSPWLMSQGHSPYAWSVLGVIGCALRVAALADENGGSAGDVDTHWCGRARLGVWRGGLGCRWIVAR